MTKFWLLLIGLVLLMVSTAEAQTCAPADLAHPLSVAISWTDNATDETGFVLERKLNTGTYTGLAASLNANIVSFTDSTVVRGSVPNTYTYRVKAMKTGAPDSAYSNEACITFAPTPPPPSNAPSDLIVK